ncbi:DegV family protein [Sediminibacillus albus]|uniref:EDD domain protein, DegV family n=1 Tax=Sediminibacillus albus TaxID=407036 RepID=A0A1G8YM15_9BACI|nr:DegV family protein [Sediminibacillus albus]SDK03773.1 EDD domain protein, DegV family [Sediminibacillus albus]
MKIAVMTDSTAYIPADVRSQKNIHMVPLNVIFEDKSYQEEVDITTEEFYPMVQAADELPKTSQPSIGLITVKLEQLAEDYDAVISVHLSSGISGTFEAVSSAGRMVKGIDVYPFDSEMSCMVQGFYALEAAEVAANGATVEQILERLDNMKETMIAYFMVDDLSNLHRGGRLNGAQAILGSMLQVKPLLYFENKKIVPFEKIRTRKRALKRMEDLFSADAQTGKPIKAVVIHSLREQEAEGLKQQFETAFPNAEVQVSYFGPVIGTHLGEGAIGLGWYFK